MIRILEIMVLLCFGLVGFITVIAVLITPAILSIHSGSSLWCLLYLPIVAAAIVLFED